MALDSQAYNDTYKTYSGKAELNLRYNLLDGEEDYKNYENPHGYDRIYANNYEYSTIRKWLNETFYETAFTELQKSIIFTTYVSNSFESTGVTLSSNNIAKRYVCYNTLDKVFLLSYDELLANLDRIEQKKIPTDYAKSQGTESGTYANTWWLRSFGCQSGNVWTNTYRSRVIIGKGGQAITDVQEISWGIVPALWIKL